MVSKEAVSGLKALVDLSTASLVDRKGNSKLGALYVCASAYTAYNPALGIAVGSNRPVYYMPLPPLSVESDDWKLKNLYCGPALTLARRHRWSSQYNCTFLLLCPFIIDTSELILFYIAHLLQSRHIVLLSHKSKCPPI